MLHKEQLIPNGNKAPEEKNYYGAIGNNTKAIEKMVMFQKNCIFVYASYIIF